MNSQSACKVYERIAATNVAAEGIRPGGLELTERALAWCRFPPGSRILDVGCGVGTTLDHLMTVHDFLATGIDASAVLLDHGRTRNPTFQLVRAVGENLPFGDAYADGVIAECSLSVMRDPDRALDEVWRILRIGGKFIVSDVYARNPGSAEQLLRIPVSCCLRGAVLQEQLISSLNRRGFKIDLWEDHSNMLTAFAVKLIFSYGSMNRFWLQSSSERINPGEIQRTISNAKPGYFLLIAEKVVDEEETSRSDSP